MKIPFSNLILKGFFMGNYQNVLQYPKQSQRKVKGMSKESISNV